MTFLYWARYGFLLLLIAAVAVLLYAHLHSTFADRGSGPAARKPGPQTRAR